MQSDIYGRGDWSRLINHVVLPSGFNEFTTSMTAFLEQCVAEGKVRNECLSANIVWSIII